MNNDDIVNALDQEIIDGESLMVEIGEQRDKFEQLLSETNSSIERVAGAVRTLQQMRQQLERPDTEIRDEWKEVVIQNDPLHMREVRNLAGHTP